MFAAYRYLASAPGVGAVWQVKRFYYNTPRWRGAFDEGFEGAGLGGRAKESPFPRNRREGVRFFGRVRKDRPGAILRSASYSSLT